MGTKPTPLTRYELESYKGQGGGMRSGRYLRFFCPIHGSDTQRSLSVDPQTGKFRCFACGAWGNLGGNDFPQTLCTLPSRRRDYSEFSREAVTGGGFGSAAELREQDALNDDKKLADRSMILLNYRRALAGSLGAKYLEKRKIPLELALRLGVGYSPQGRWAHAKRDWKLGRVVFPHTTPDGKVINLYGRAVEFDEPAPKPVRHDHLPGIKGIFNARGLSCETVFLCEGVFDALGLMSFGVESAAALFGLDGLRWEWLSAKRVVFALDQDKAGEKWRELAWEAVVRGYDVYWLPPEAYGGCKDASEAWQKGVLDIGEFEPAEKFHWSDLPEEPEFQLVIPERKSLIFPIDPLLEDFTCCVCEWLVDVDTAEETRAKYGHVLCDECLAEAMKQSKR